MELGYRCLNFVLSNRDYGSLPERMHVWWVCAKNLKGAVEEIDRFFMSIITGAKVRTGEEIIDRSRYLFMEPKARKAICRTLRIPTVIGTGPRKSKTEEKDDPGWRTSCLDRDRSPSPFPGNPNAPGLGQQSNNNKQHISVCIYIHSTF